MPDQAPRIRLRVLIVDADAVVRDLVAAELTAAGCDVETLASGTGLSEDMIRLIRPDVLIIDPFLEDVSIEAVGRVLIALRGKEAFKLVLIDDTEDHEEFSKFAGACRADGVISKRDLLRAPAEVAADEYIPEFEVVMDEESKAPPLAAATDQEIEFVMNFDFLEPRPPLGPQTPEASTPRRPRVPRPPPPAPLEAFVLPDQHVGFSVASWGGRSRPRPEEPKQTAVPTAEAAPPPASPPRPSPPSAPPPPASPSSASPPRASPPRGTVLSMIQHQVGTVPKAPPRRAETFVVEINLFSRSNFYVGASGTLETGGVFVATATLPEVGDHAHVQLRLLSLPPLETEGVVEWVRQANPLARVAAGAGISLAHLPREQRAPLEAFLGERAPLTYRPVKPP